MAQRLVIALVAAFTLLACNISDEESGPQLGNAETMDAGGGDMEDASGNSCTPASCSEDDCGTIDDGCGGTIECGECGCTADNFETFCPEMPCMTVTGCDASECAYEPVSCGGFECACEDPDNCSDDELRWCRDSQALTCPADACNPDPSTNSDGSTSYGNVCEQPEGAFCDFSDLCVQGACAGTDCVVADCGQCNLGYWDCDEDGERTCFDIPASSVDPAEINCNDRSADSTFVYLDFDVGTDEPGSGSRDQPFSTLDAAMDAAESRAASGVIVKSGYVYGGTLEVRNGISIYSGFSGAPDWTFDEGFMQVNGGVIGVDATSIDQRTVLHRLQIGNSAPASPGESSYGVRAVDSGSLVLSEVQIAVEPGADGSPGSSGRDGSNGASAPPVFGRAGGSVGPSRCGVSANGGPGGDGGRQLDPGQTGEVSATGIRGGPGGPPGNIGGPGGQAPRAGAAGDSGAAGTRSFEVVDDLWVARGNGTAGTGGSPGFGGGGGGGGGGSPISLFNDFGGGGGGGGGGGCPGDGGTGGGPAGSSFGLFLINSTGLTVIDSQIRAGDGGDGGRGGPGGRGGAGGVGARGAPPSGSSAGAGGKGGDGTPGGNGGAGGGGAGGDSVGVHCEGTTVIPEGSTLEVGSPGAGGNAPNPGDNGVAIPARGCEQQ